MRILIFVSILVLSFSVYANDRAADIRDIKKAMYRSIESSAVTDSLYTDLKSRTQKDALLMAYIGTLEALKAKHAWNPYHKIRYVSLSQQTMAKAVSRDPGNMEIRFMRFSIQHYTPAFLGFSREIDEDIDVIVKQYKNKSFGLADKSLVRNIAAFMISSKRCSKEESALFKKYV